MESDHLLVHGTTVDLGGKAVLLRGPPGSGKSDLALRLMDEGAALIADDQTCLKLDSPHIMASVPPTIAGMIEVRGIGIMRVPHHNHVPLGLVVEMTPSANVERLPEPENTGYFDIVVPLLRLAPFEVSTPVKIRYWLSFGSGVLQ